MSTTPRSSPEWCHVPALFGGESLPVAADVMHSWLQRAVKVSSAAVTASVPQPRLLVISPHPDDAALSVGGLVLAATGRWERHIGTLVGISDYEVAHEPSDVTGISSRRHEQDRRFAALVGAVLHPGNALDAPLRAPGYGIFRPPSQEHVAEFTALVRRWVVAIQPQLVLAPLGIAGHADHVAARLAVTAISQGGDFDVLLYEDLPYAARAHESCNVPGVSVRPRWMIGIEEYLLLKVACLSAYPTQFDLASMQRTLANHASSAAGYVERFHELESHPLSERTLRSMQLLAAHPAA